MFYFYLQRVEADTDLRCFSKRALNLLSDFTPGIALLLAFPSKPTPIWSEIYVTTTISFAGSLSRLTFSLTFYCFRLCFFVCVVYSSMC